jgi:hypothetical protein
MDLITSIPPLELQSGADIDYMKACLDSWRKYNFRIVTLNREDEAESVKRTFGLNPIVFRDSEHSFYPGKFGPSFGEISKHLSPHRSACIINADAYILENLDLTHFADLCVESCFFSQTVEVYALNVPF